MQPSLPYILALISVFLNVAGQFYAKIGSQRLSLSSWQVLLTSFVLNPSIILSVFCYGTSLCIWIYILSKLSFTTAVSMNCLTYVLTLLISAFVLKETFHTYQVVGSLLIVGGIILVSAKI